MNELKRNELSASEMSALRAADVVLKAVFGLPALLNACRINISSNPIMQWEMLGDIRTVKVSALFAGVVPAGDPPLEIMVLRFHGRQVWEFALVKREVIWRSREPVDTGTTWVVFMDSKGVASIIKVYHDESINSILQYLSATYAGTAGGAKTTSK